MKVYVDELPKDCLDCPFCQDIKVNAGMDRLLFCKANKGKAIKNIEKSFDKCIVKNEFQSLTDYTKQVRKEVCEEMRNLAEKDFDFDTCTCCCEDVHDDVVLTKSDFKKN